MRQLDDLLRKTPKNTPETLKENARYTTCSEIVRYN